MTLEEDHTDLEVCRKYSSCVNGALLRDEETQRSSPRVTE